MLIQKEKEDKRDRDAERFFNLLKAAVKLAGGIGDSWWDKVNMQTAYKQLHGYGIKLKIKLDDNFIKNHYPMGDD